MVLLGVGLVGCLSGPDPVDVELNIDITLSNISNPNGTVTVWLTLFLDQDVDSRKMPDITRDLLEDPAANWTGTLDNGHFIFTMDEHTTFTGNDETTDINFMDYSFYANESGYSVIWARAEGGDAAVDISYRGDSDDCDASGSAEFDLIDDADWLRVTYTRSATCSNR